MDRCWRVRRRRIARLATFVTVASALGSDGVTAQVGPASPPIQMESAATGLRQTQDASIVPRRWALMAGLGNSLAWLGASADFYFSEGRFSAFGSLGYTPEFDEGEASGVTVAAGIRAYTGHAASPHRAFLELAGSQIAIQNTCARNAYGFCRTVDSQRLYGPALSGGYRFTSRRGFTLIASLGVGYAIGVDETLPDGSVEDLSPWAPVLGLGLGYAWPR